MRYLLILFCLSIGNKCDELIVWKDSLILNFDDFKGTPDSLSEYSALTYYHLDRRIEINASIVRLKIVSCFEKNNSWIKVRDSSILMHENLHFAIVELFARKTKCQFENETFSKNNADENISLLIKQYDASLNTIQDQYDAETDFSRNKISQDKWNKMIKSQLKYFEKYKDSVVVKSLN